MARQLDPKIGEVFKQYGLGANACWDCHGTWVAYHWALESVAAQAGVVFGPPNVLEADGNAKCVALAVTGTLGDKSEWSIGEASEHNYRTKGKQAAYPYAMAEKRAKDRVILKLIGLHGLVYSEEEADDFQAPKQPQNGAEEPPKANGKQPLTGPEKTMTGLKAKMRDFHNALMNIQSLDDLKELETVYDDALEQCAIDLPKWWDNADPDHLGIKQRLEQKKDQFDMNPLNAG